MNVPTIEEFMKEGLTLEQAFMAQEAMASSCIEGAKPITAKRMADIIRGHMNE